MPVLNDAANMQLGAAQVVRVMHRGVEVWAAPVVPANTSPPVVTGAAFVGDTASTSTGAWSGSPTAYEYRWQQLDGASWDDIIGATGATFEVEAVGEYRAAVRAQNAAGWSDWAYSEAFVVVEPASGMTWGYANAYGEIAGGGLIARRQNVAGTQYANFRSTDPLPAGRHYIEGVIVMSAASNGLAGFGLIGDTIEPSGTGDPFDLQYWQAPRGIVAQYSAWSVNWAANYGLPSQSSGYIDAPGNVPQTHTVAFAVDNRDPAAVRVWARVDGGAWLLGGDPATDTTPTFILPDTTALYLGASSRRHQSTVTIRTPDEHSGTAPSAFVPR